jgi:hypothetical protein
MFVLEAMVKNSLLAWGGAVYLSIGHTVPSTNTIEESIPACDTDRPLIIAAERKAAAAFLSTRARLHDAIWKDANRTHALSHSVSIIIPAHS